jgi:dTDP-4-amino-4,6-dideoxygalactose transaminase
MSDAIPHFALGPSAAEIGPQVLERWRRLLETTAFVGGHEVADFEERFAEYLGASGCVGVANGTDALVLGLKALGLRPGDQVLVPAFTFFATAEAVVWAGGKPIFADVEEGSLNLDPGDADARCTDRTVGVVAVHLFGQPCDLDGVRALCRRRKLWLLEDAAQAHGATWRERRVGTLGELAAWSFYPSKNLGCFGDGGAVTAGEPEALARVRLLSNHGRIDRYHHGEVGTNSRLDALQAAVLSLRLPLLERQNQRRREIARRYRQALTGVGDLRFQEAPSGAVSVCHQVTVRTIRRDDLQDWLARHSVGTAVFYPEPLHRQPAFRHVLPEPPRLPVSEAAAREVLSLPVYEQLSDAQVDRVCELVRGFFEPAGSG